MEIFRLELIGFLFIQVKLKTAKVIQDLYGKIKADYLL